MSGDAELSIASFEYTHLTNFQVTDNQYVNCGTWIANISGDHLDFRDGLHPNFQNPLGSNFRITPFADNSDPVIEMNSIVLTRDGNPNEIISPSSVNGRIDIIAEIRDPITPGTARNNVHRIGFEILGHLFLQIRHRYDYWWSSGVSTVYTPSTQVNPPDPTSRFFYYVTNNANSSSPPSNGYWDSHSLPNGNYYLRVWAFDNRGRSDSEELLITVSNTTDVQQISDVIPTTYALNQNYPNPFNPETVIRYQLPVNSFVSLKVYDLLGREIRTLVNDEQQAGYYEATWDGKDDAGKYVSSGVYFYRITAGEFVDKKSMVLPK